MDVLEELARGLERGHQHGAAGDGQPVDGLQPVPGPGLDALGEGVVDADGDVDLLGLVAGHVLLELFLRVGDDGEVLGRDAVALRAVAVAAEGDAPPAGLAYSDPSRLETARVVLTAGFVLAACLRRWLARSSGRSREAGLTSYPGIYDISQYLSSGTT